MDLDFKRLFKSKEEYDSFRKSDIFKEFVYSSYIGEPSHYPAVLIYWTRYRDNGPDSISGEYVYLEDFND